MREVEGTRQAQPILRQDALEAEKPESAEVEELTGTVDPEVIGG